MEMVNQSRISVGLPNSLRDLFASAPTSGIFGAVCGLQPIRAKFELSCAKLAEC